MARVDFYVLKGSGDDTRWRFACRLAEKAYRLKNSVHIQVQDSGEAARLDDLLWTFRDGSFVPHEIARNRDSVQAPITIGSSPLQADLLVNLTDALPDNIDSFPRVAEIVTSDDDRKARSRRQFVAYRDAGHTLETHNL